LRHDAAGEEHCGGGERGVCAQTSKRNQRRSDCHLDRAIKPRSRSSDARVHADGLDKGGGRRSAHADAESKHRSDNSDQSRPVGYHEGEKRRRRHNAEGVGDNQKSRKRKAPNQPACEKAAEPETGDEERKIPSNAGARDAQRIDKNEWRAGDERIEGSLAQAPPIA
jgi:hypothetical protein